jgi:type II secretory pathway component PulF
MNKIIDTWWLHWQFTRKRQVIFLEDLCSLVDDGVPVSQAIETISEISEGVNKKVAQHIGRCLAEGQLLADGMQGFFNHAIVEVVRAGENGGNLPASLRAALESFSEHANAFSVVINSLVYPSCVIVLALIVVVFIKNAVLVNFAQIKPVYSWPETGRNLYFLAVLIERWWWLLLLMLIGAIFVLRRILQRLTGEPRRLLDSFPLLSLYREMVAARFMETLGLLISNGIVLKQALSVMHNEGSPYLSWHLLQMEARLSSGQENIAEVLNTDLIERNDLIRLRVVTRGKNFEAALISLGRQANKRNIKSLNTLGKVLAGMMLIGGAFIAAMVVLGIYSIGSILAG